MNLFVRDNFFNVEANEKMTSHVLNHDQEIGYQTLDDVFDLAIMLGIPEEKLEEIVDNTELNADFDENVMTDFFDKIIDKLNETGYDADGSENWTYDSVYWFAKGYNAKKGETEAINELMNLPFQPEIKYLGIPHAPKQPKAPKRYIDSNFLVQNLSSLKIQVILIFLLY